MVDWKYLLFAQYPAFFILAVFFLILYMRVRKSSAVKSILWVLLFGAALACSVLFAFLGVQQKYWTLGALFPLSAASWIGVVLVVATMIAHVVHTIEKKHNRKVMEKELQKAAKERDDAVAQVREESAEALRQAHEEGRKAAYQEAEAARFTQAAEAAGAEAMGSEIAQAAAEPIALTFDAPSVPDAPMPDAEPEVPDAQSGEMPQ